MKSSLFLSLVFTLGLSINAEAFVLLPNCGEQQLAIPSPFTRCHGAICSDPSQGEGPGIIGLPDTIDTGLELGETVTSDLARWASQLRGLCSPVDNEQDDE